MRRILRILSGRGPAQAPRLAAALLVLSAGASLGQKPGAIAVDPPFLPSVGEVVSLRVEPDLAGVSEGRWVDWRHAVHQPGARFVKPHFVEVELRAGDTLTVSTAAGRAVEVIRERGPKQRGTFWGLSVPGDTLVLELHTRHAYRRAPFTLDRLIAGSESPLASSSAGRTVCQPAEFEDSVCYQSQPAKWANISASVALMVVGGLPESALFCSGVNISPLGHLLTNAHCLGNQLDCDNAEIVFGYRRTGCNDGSPPTDQWTSVRCDELLAVSPLLNCEPAPDTLDFALASLVADDTVPERPFVRVADELPVNGEALYIVQHPMGRPQEITHGSGADVVADPGVLRYFGSLDTEPGSSGSPVFRESDHQLIALHHCGDCNAASGNRAIPIQSFYPMLAPYLCAQTLTVASAGSTGLSEVDGNGNGVAEPGETWSFRPVVRNLSCSSSAVGLVGTVRFVGPTGAVRLLATAVSFGTVAPGQAVPSAETVTFEVGPLTACGTALRFDLTSLTAGAVLPDLLGVQQMALGELVRTSLFFDDFSGGLSAAWTIEDGGTGTGPAATWTAANPGSRNPPLVPPFAIADSDEHGLGQLMDEGLITPAINAVAYGGLRLTFRHQFNYYELGIAEIGQVDVRSSATGGAWQTLRTYAGADSQGPDTVDLGPLGAGRADVQVRFRYSNARFEWWWAVDEVRFEGDNGYVCEPHLGANTIFADGFASGDTGAWTSHSP